MAYNFLRGKYNIKVSARLKNQIKLSNPTYHIFITLYIHRVSLNEQLVFLFLHLLLRFSMQSGIRSIAMLRNELFFNRRLTKIAQR